MIRAARARQGVALLLLAAAAGAVLAQSGGEFRLGRQVIAGGGGRLAGGEFVAEVTLAQPHAAEQSGGEWRLRGGFQAGHTAAGPLPGGERIFHDGFEG